MAYIVEPKMLGCKETRSIGFLEALKDPQNF
jgi:hypothetical protein